MMSAVDAATEAALGGAFSLREWQMERVRALVPRLRENSAYYSRRLAGIDASRVARYEDMESLPFTFPGELAANPEEFLCVPGKDIARVAKATTSGTVDAPKMFFFTAGDLERTVDFFRVGMTDVAGRGGFAAILLSTGTPDSVGDLLARALERNGTAARVMRENPDAGEIRRVIDRAGCVVGMPASIIKLCRTYRDLRPSSVLLTADYVPDSIARDVSRIWECDVFTHYGMTETGYGCAVQCKERKSHHIRHSEILIEIVDPVTGKQMPPGCSGEIVVTTFAQEAVPLLRYRTGDISRETAETCPCGGKFPGLGKIMGRSDNMVCDGVSLAELDEIVFEFDAVLGYHVRAGGNEAIHLDVEAFEYLDRTSFEGVVADIAGGLRMVFSYNYSAPVSAVKKRKVER
jgi:phenylacetate-coenzyme A ligase PaaK-like adenylate-forming protein